MNNEIIKKYKLRIVLSTEKSAFSKRLPAHRKTCYDHGSMFCPTCPVPTQIDYMEETCEWVDLRFVKVLDDRPCLVLVQIPTDSRLTAYCPHCDHKHETTVDGKLISYKARS